MLNNILTNVLKKNFAIILITAIFFIGSFFVATLVFAAPSPTVTSISPTSGTTAGGTSVTIVGTGFLTGPTVTIGGNAATNVVRVNSTNITATTPAGTAGVQNVVVTNTDSKSGTLTNGFTYVAPTHTITASAGSNGSISPSGAVSVNDGDSQSFSITADANYHVADVLVDSVSVGAVTSYNFTNVVADHTIAAIFAVDQATYTLTYTAGANGSITGTSPQTVNSGSDGTAVAAVPANGYYFVNWSDALTANPRTDTNVTANISVTANFAVDQATYTLTYTAGANGSITGTSPQTVNSGSDGTAVAAVPANGYYFVNWSDALTANPRTDTNVTANISVTANFAVVSSETATPATPAVIEQKNTRIVFNGRAYPGAVITLLEKSGSQETPVQQAKITSSDGSFTILKEGLFSGYYSYGLKVADKDNRVAPTRFYEMDVGLSSENEKNIFVPPTLGIAKQTVFKGDDAVLLGYATPRCEVNAEIDGKGWENFTIADAFGFYRLAVNTQNLSQGSHTARARQSDTYLGVKSDWSILSSFVISTSAKTKADFNNDGKVSIADWSVFLFRWGSRDQKLRSAIDMDGNGKIDVADLSIFLKTMQL